MKDGDANIYSFCSSLNTSTIGEKDRSRIDECGRSLAAQGRSSPSVAIPKENPPHML